MAIFGETAGVLFRIKADASQGSAEIKKFIAEVSGMSEKTIAALEKIAGPAAAVAGIIGGIGLVAIGVTKELLDLTKEAVEYGSKIHDAGQQTGLTAETISALKFAADESGSSLEAITGSVAKFSALLGSAKEGNEKAIATLDKYGITARTTDAALSQAIKTIAEMKDHDLQAAAAKDLFRERTAAILPVIQSFDGDLPKLISHLRELGLIMSQEDADAADAFGDQMDTLNKQLMGVKITLGTQLMPVFQEWTEQVSSWLAKNKDEVKDWGQTIGTVLKTAIIDIKQESLDLEAIGEILNTLNPFSNDTWNKLPDRLEKIRQKEQELEDQRRDAQFRRTGQSGGTSYALDQNNNVITPDIQGQDASKNYTYGKTPLDAEAEKKRAQAAEDRRKARETAYKKELQDQSEHYVLLIKGEHESFVELNKKWEEGFLKGEKTKETFREAALNNITAFGQKAQGLLDKQLQIDVSGKTGTERENIILKYQQASEAVNNELVRSRADVEKTITGVVKKETDERIKIAKEETQAVIDAAKNKTDTLISQFELMKSKGIISEKQYAEIVGELATRQLELERALTDDAQKRQAIDEKIAQQKNRNAIEGIEQTNKEIKATNDAAEAYEKYRQAVWNAEMQQAKIIAQQAELADQVTLTGVIFQEFGNILQDAFDGFANALANVVQQWVILGTTGPAVMRKILASALATIAAEAAVRAIYAAAYGFLMLATGDFYSAGQAFLAAAVFGTIAGVAALAGRAIAGNSFQKQSSAATGKSASSSSSSSSSGTGGTQYSSQPNSTIEEGRNTPGLGPLDVRLTLAVESNDSHIVKVVQKNVGRNGELRDLMVKGT